MLHTLHSIDLYNVGPKLNIVLISIITSYMLRKNSWAMYLSGHH